MRTPLIIGNWKLNGRLAENTTRLRAIVTAVKHINQVDIGLCLPYVYLFQAQQILSNTNVMWGAQNVSQFEQGAYTACVSAAMVADFGCQLAIVGHSERRHYSAENSAKAVMRIKRAVDAKMTPVYCIGETQAEHAAGDAKKVIQAQVMALFDSDKASLETIKSFGLAIAYEPIWAIGADQAATPALAQNRHAFIRDLLAKQDATFAAQTRIIYGGSVTPDNAKALFEMPDIDGGLIGRASLNAHHFAAICAAAVNHQIAH
jgi:triosephosphate isomerase (TIM)